MGKTEALEKQKRKVKIRNDPNFRDAFEKLLRELKGLGLKSAQTDLLRAFLEISNGKTEFEASFSDLGKILYNTNGKFNKKTNKNVSYALSILYEWQENHKVTLIETVKKGCRTTSAKGTFNYEKSKFKFLLLAQLLKAFKENPKDVAKSVKKILKNIGKNYVKIEKGKNYHSRHLMKKAKQTIFTKFEKAFEYADKAGDDPNQYCEKIIQMLQVNLNYLKNERGYEINRINFIRQFEKLIKPEMLKRLKENTSNNN